MQACVRPMYGKGKGGILLSEKLGEDEDEAEDRPRLGFDFAVGKMGGNQRCAYSVAYP